MLLEKLVIIIHLYRLICYLYVQSCKYWRFRIYALPSNQPGTKKILEDPSGTCDVYTRLTREENYNLLEEFLRFVESIVNKIRRIAGLKPQPKVWLT